MAKTVHMFDGIPYKPRPADGQDVKTILDGGPMGGMVFVNGKGEYGFAGFWYPTFAEAARYAFSSQHLSYEIAKKKVDEYEAQAKVLGLKIG